VKAYGCDVDSSNNLHIVTNISVTGAAGAELSSHDWNPSTARNPTTEIRWMLDD